jgi:hypothetical protein
LAELFDLGTGCLVGGQERLDHCGDRGAVVGGSGHPGFSAQVGDGERAVDDLRPAADQPVEGADEAAVKLGQRPAVAGCWCTTLLTGAGAGREQYHQHSTGDGYIFSIDPHVPRTMLLTELLDGLHQRLTSFNRRKLRAEQVRVRLAMHGGEVLRDPDPLEGAATILTCRLLDADVLRTCLRVTSQPLAAIASRAIWEGIIRHDPQGS